MGEPALISPFHRTVCIAWPAALPRGLQNQSAPLGPQRAPNWITLRTQFRHSLMKEFLSGPQNGPQLSRLRANVAGQPSLNPSRAIFEMMPDLAPIGEGGSCGAKHWRSRRYHMHLSFDANGVAMAKFDFPLEILAGPTEFVPLADLARALGQRTVPIVIG